MAGNGKDKTSESVTGEALQTAPTPRRLRLPLNSAVDIRKELARLYKAMKTGEIAPADGTKLAYVLNILRQVIETSEIEQRIASLENGQDVGSTVLAALKAKHGHTDDVDLSKLSDSALDELMAARKDKPGVH